MNSQRKIYKKFIPYSHQWIDNSDVEEVVKVLKSYWITQGPKVREFEEALSLYCGAKYATVFSSGTAALHGAYSAIGIEKNDEIITSPITFAATSNAALFLGSKAVFVDIEPDTGNINPDLISDKITPHTKAIIPVHFAGHPVNLDKIHKIAKKHNLVVIEDASHAIGARYKNKKIGCLSDLTVFSFHPAKPITTGEGGAVLTNNKEFYERLLMFRTHGMTKEKKKLNNPTVGDWYYEMHFLGFNYRLTDIQSALGISQLYKIDRFIEKRRQIVDAYRKAFEGKPYFYLPVERDYAYSSWHLYPIRLKNDYKNNRREIFSKMRENGLGVQVHYIPVYLLPYYQNLGYKKGLCPVAENFYEKEISIPLYQSMSDDDVTYVRSTVLEIFENL